MFWYMEIVSIEKETFEMMLASFNALSEKVAALRRKSCLLYTSTLTELKRNHTLRTGGGKPKGRRT